ncbi:hypothetical protein SAMN05216570_3335 [Dyella sp. OK004]|uniref:hypothetical protein n=1 Tax=Dyella sp. OK004 TaxID=1855292 RepID=UPI0008EB6D5F|nr:hypothetical protein [Dyella sp. OK004]SFS16569.1 hypothetical protein SAMN05216570_3335 [Dyella sp. OK004]
MPIKTRLAVAAITLLLSAVTPWVSHAAQTDMPAAARDSSRDLDFLRGSPWHVHNRQLPKRLAGSHDWVEFDATDEFIALPGNLGNEEHYRTDHWKDFVSVAFQLYNPKTRQWNEYFVENRSAPGVLQPPVTGGFTGDVGHFEGQDTYAGKPITVRTTWRRLGPNHVTWEQAFSPDGGKSWETNWTMDFTR